MSAEAASHIAFTPAQLENQRLFRVGPAMTEHPGDKAKRIQRKLTILAGATAADLAEGAGAEWLLGKIKQRAIISQEQIVNEMPDWDEKKEGAKSKLIQKKALFSGLGFVEDAASDELYVVGMNAILRGMTGLDEVSYPTPTARVISGWTNLLSFASGKFEKKQGFWKKPWNFVNAVNVEAAIGLLEEVPGIGRAVERAHAAMDHKLSKSEAIQFGNAIAMTAVTGYHIEKNMVNASKE